MLWRGETHSTNAGNRLPVTDLSRLAPQAAQQEARRVTSVDAATPFDLTTPAVGVPSHSLGDEDDIILLALVAAHHL